MLNNQIRQPLIEEYSGKVDQRFLLSLHLTLGNVWPVLSTQKFVNGGIFEKEQKEGKDVRVAQYAQMHSAEIPTIAGIYNGIVVDQKALEKVSFSKLVVSQRFAFGPVGTKEFAVLQKEENLVQE